MFYHMKFLIKSKRIYLVSAFTCMCIFLTNAQVGINTITPNASSALDITSTDKGFLMTKVALTGTDDVTTISPFPETGVLVFNTATAGSPTTAVVPGFYYFNGVSWRRFYTQGYTLSYEQTSEATANPSNTTYEILPGLDTGEITVPFSGTYQIRVEGYYSAGNTIDTNSDGASQGSLSLAMESISTIGSGSSGGCTGGITSYPYFQSFEDDTIGDWSHSPDDDLNWRIDDNGTPTGSTGPSSGSDGDFYAFVESSTNGTGFPFKQAILISPCFDLTASPEATFSFDYHMRSNVSNPGSIALEVSDDDGENWTELWFQDQNQSNNWITENISLNAYIGSTIQLRFNRITGTTFRPDVAVDNIHLTETSVTSFSTIKETYLTTSSKQLGATNVNNLAQSASILVNIDLIAGTTYRFVVRGREWLTNNVLPGSFGKDTNSYTGNSVNDAQRGTMSISLIKQL